MTQEQKTKIGEHFDELHAIVSDCGFNPPNDISDALRAAYLAGADYALEIYRPHWISVEDELPPIGGIVLVAIPLGGELSVLPLSIKNESDFEYLSGMTHWMPLPSIEHLKD